MIKFKSENMVIHSLFCRKLGLNFNVTHSAVELIKSYLSQRFQCVSTDYGVSDLKLITSSVPKDRFLDLFSSVCILMIFQALNATAVFTCLPTTYSFICQVQLDKNSMVANINSNLATLSN